MVPFEAGAFRCSGSAFRIFEFEGGEFPKTVYLESFEGARYFEVPETVASFQDALDESVKTYRLRISDCNDNIEVAQVEPLGQRRGR